ncbi:MAG TPA: hypothetical protein VF862_12605 [Gemmatimonadales bacterium]
MHRRDFLVSAAAVALPRFPEASVPRAWTWVHGGEGTPAEWRSRFRRIAKAGVGGVLVGGGDTALLSDAARAEGLQFHRWSWALNRTGDAWVKEHHPEWFSVSREGKSSLTHPPYVGYYQWLCPSRPEVRGYLRGVMADLAGDPRIDGVHLDYIRHPDVILPRALWPKYNLVQDREYPPFDFCYCEVCRASFWRETGTDPRDLSDPAISVAWREYRWRSVTRVVETVAEAVHARGKPISAAVFPTPTIARALVRQAWETWPVDVVFPMIYHGFYLQPVSWVGEAAREGVTRLAGRRPLVAGLYLPDLNPADLGQAVGLALGAGAAGVSVFEMGGLSDAHLRSLRPALG